MGEAKLFPESLTLTEDNPHTAANACVQVWMQAKGFNPALVPDGKYQKQSIVGMQIMQERLGLPASVDFDHATRVALKLVPWGMDFEALPANLFVPAAEPTSVDPPLSKVYA